MTLNDLMAKEGLRVVLFKSRNKDNRGLDGFKERSVGFVSTRGLDQLEAEFQDFVRKGMPGELCRMYVTVNRRDNAKVLRGLQHYLLDHPEMSAASLPAKLSSIAEQKENAVDHHWLFDFDGTDERHQHFLSTIKGLLARMGHTDVEVFSRKTVNGHAVVVSRGFDTRELMRYWSDPEEVSLKRDAKLLWTWARTPEQ
jgi:hypothetical protein